MAATMKSRALLSGGAAVAGAIGSYVAFGGGLTDPRVVWAYRKLVQVPYEGEKNKEGRPHGFGEQRDELSGVHYRGQYEDGRLNGVGTLVQRNGEVYTGPFTNNLRHGRGTLSLQDAQKNGFEATLNFSLGLIDEANTDGVVIKRTFGNGVWLYEGPSLRFYPKNTNFPFLFNGTVKISYTNSFDEEQNYIFEGDVADNKKLRGTLTVPSKQLTYHGLFVDDVSCDGDGRISYANGDVYTGGVYALRRRGPGTIVKSGWLWRNSRRGYFLDDTLVDVRSGKPFYACKSYAGPLAGYVFTRGARGQGYYIDAAAAR